MKNKNPLITVITLSYYSPDLFLCIDSVLRQTYPQIQYIIIDDGTLDFNTESVKKYIESNQSGNIKDLIVIANEKNLGISKSFNIGLKLANGEIIFNVSGDDEFADKDVLTDWVSAFQKNNASIMTAYRMVYDNDLKKKIYVAPQKSEVKLIKKYKSQPEKLFEKISSVNIIFGCCTAQTKKSYETYGFRDEQYRLIDDHPYYLNILRKGQEIEFFDRIVIKYRQGGVSFGNNVDNYYYQDADKIIKNEVLPYVSNQKKAIKKYNKWKKDIAWEAKLAEFKQSEKQYENKKLKLFSGRMIFAIKNPIRVSKKIFSYVKRKIVLK